MLVVNADSSDKQYCLVHRAHAVSERYAKIIQKLKKYQRGQVSVKQPSIHLLYLSVLEL